MIKKLQALKAKKGFTLVELIVVIAIIGVLAAILVPTMLNYVTSSRVTSVDSTAASIKNNIDTFLTNCDTAGYGMLKGNTNMDTFKIDVTTGVWTVNMTNTGAFRNGNGKTWAGGGAGSAGATKVGVTDPSALLAIELADLFPEVQTASIGALVQGGKCMAVYYTADTNGFSAQLDALLGSGGWTSDTCAWDNSTAGVTTEGFIAGTAPKLPLG